MREGLLSFDFRPPSSAAAGHAGTDQWCTDARACSAGAQGQGIFAASRCLWDEKTDNYVSASYYNNSLFAVATVFACYYE